MKMRERTTWNEKIVAASVAKRASARVAEDPRALDPKHFQEQPADDKYVIGDPTDFAEDVAPSGPSWKAEQGADGETKRNDINMPEFRGDTFKTATIDPELAARKSVVAVQVAKAMLKNASEAAIEDQALALMNLTDSQLIDTQLRLAADEDDDDDKGGDQGGQQAQGQQSGQQQDKTAGELPPGFKEQIEKKKEEAKDNAGQEGQDKKASLSDTLASCMQAMQQGDQALAQQYMQQAMGQCQAEPAMAGQQQQQLDVMAQLQQMQEMMAQQQQVQQAPAATMQASDQELMEMVLGPTQQMDGFISESDITFDPQPLDDIGPMVLAADDAAALAGLFNQDKTYQAALKLAQESGQYVEDAQPVVANVKTASATRPVGTNPSGGVAKIGGVVGGSASDTDVLSNIWRSAPDVRDAFR